MPRLNPSSAVGNTALAYARTWRNADATGLVLGRMATRIAIVLMGKHKPIYDQANDCGDYVVVTNAKQVVVSGRKSDRKLYRHHSGFPGGLKEIPYKTLMEKKPEEIIRRAVSGMLPKNRLRAKRLERLFIYPDNNHPYEQNFLRDYASEFKQEFKNVKEVPSVEAVPSTP